MATFGETLKRERELRKITLREVSGATKIGLRYLEALEATRFENLPGGLFNKGFIRAYAKFIGLDGEALVNAYLFDLSSQQNPQPARPRYPGVNIDDVTPPLPAPDESSSRAGRQRALAIGAAAALVLLSGFALITFRGMLPDRGHGPEKPDSTMKAVIGGGVTGSPAATPSPEPAPASRTDNPPAGEPAPPGTDLPPEPAKPAEEGLSLSLAFSETTWIGIVCDGTERLNKEIPSGDTVVLSCRQEIRISTGNAGATAMRVNGRECLPLGERGGVIRDLVLNAERVAEICPLQEE